MSVTFRLDLVCDECGKTLPCVTADYAPAKKQARSFAHPTGWRTIGTKDYCPTCWAEFVAGKRAVLTARIPKDLIIE